MIWLVGNRGMLGTDVEHMLSRSGKEYTVTDREVDITTLSALESFMSDQKVTDLSYIINCAAYTAVDKAENEEDKAFRLNAEGPRNLAKIARETGAVLIHLSTDYVFDGKKQGTYREDDPVHPLNVYGKSKLEGEIHVQKEMTRFFIFRTAWLYGRNGNNFVKTMIRLFKEKDELTVVSDQTGNPTCTKDCAEVILEIINSDADAFGIYHVTNQGKTSWYEFARYIYEYGKQKGFIHRDVTLRPIPAQEYRTPAARPYNSCLCKEKLKKNLGIIMRPWEEALDDYLDQEEW
jgi:dTDP-4-dehydrorhamnose reductase